MSKPKNLTYNIKGRPRKSDQLTSEQKERLGLDKENRGKPYKEYRQEYEKQADKF